MRNILVTGGAGFIGSAVVRQLIAETGDKVLNVDKLTYAGNLASVAAAADDPRYRFARHDICDRAAMERLFAEFRPDVVLHLAAESHVDRSIDDPSPFVQTNVVGTFNLLEVARRYWRELEGAARTGFRFHHVSTDEVFGSLGDDGFFTEETPYAPNSPYSSSKASSDHLARAWHRTYGLPVLVTNCSNNYGPYQFPEKLIPLMITKALKGEKLPVYGTGANVRDWLYVEDHARALRLVYETGRIGETYNLGGGGERTNLEIVETLCDTLDALFRDAPWRPHRSLIGFVEDRPGHDLRYAIDASKIQGELGWRPAETFETGLAKTVRWYIDNPDWCATAHAGGYQGERLGAAEVAGASV